MSHEDTCGCCEKHRPPTGCVCESMETCKVGGWCVLHCPCDECRQWRTLMQAADLRARLEEKRHDA